MYGLAGAPTDYNSYMGLCMANAPTGPCGVFDFTCISRQNAAADVCQQQYLTDPNSPHNSITPTAVPAAVDVSSVSAGSPGQENPAAAAFVQSFQPAAIATTPATPTVAIQTSPAAAAPPASQSSPASQAPTANVLVSSPAPATAPTSTVPSTTSGFSFSSIPTWGWIAAAGVALFAFSRH